MPELTKFNPTDNVKPEYVQLAISFTHNKHLGLYLQTISEERDALREVLAEAERFKEFVGKVTLQMFDDMQDMADELSLRRPNGDREVVAWDEAAEIAMSFHIALVGSPTCRCEKYHKEKPKEHHRLCPAWEHNMPSPEFLERIELIKRGDKTSSTLPESRGEESL